MTLPLPEDAHDLVVELSARGVEFMVVGGHALAVHGVVRATLDFDVFVRASPDNAVRVFDALRAFGAPLVAHGVEAGDFATPGTVYQLGLPPFRIDVLTQISGVAFEDAWPERVIVRLGEQDVPFLGVEALRVNKRAAGRPKDLADVAALDARARES